MIRVGRHLVPDRELIGLANRLSALEHQLAPTSGDAAADSAVRRLAHDCVVRDLEVVSTALGRARHPAD
jgi:hypothetical protein